LHIIKNVARLKAERKKQTPNKPNIYILLLSVVISITSVSV